MAIRTNYTFQDIFELVRDTVLSQPTGKKPTFWGIGSLFGNFTKAFALLFQWLQLNVNIAYQSFRLITSKGIHLDRRVGDWGLERKQPTFAFGTQVFEGISGRVADKLIPAGTEVRTEEDVFGRFVSFTLLNDITLLSSEPEVTGLVECTQAGTIGNVASGTINTLPSDIPEVAIIYNPESFSTGQNLEKDDELRTRLPATVLGYQTGNKSAIESAILSVANVDFVNLIENTPTLGTFTAFVNNEAGVFDSFTIAQINEAIDNVIGININYTLSLPQTRNINISGDIEIDSDNFSSLDLINKVKQRISDLINKKRKSEILISDIIVEAKKELGIINIKNVYIDGENTDYDGNRSGYTENEVLKINELADIFITII